MKDTVVSTLTHIIRSLPYLPGVCFLRAKYGQGLGLPTSKATLGGVSALASSAEGPGGLSSGQMWQPGEDGGLLGHILMSLLSILPLQT